MATQIRLKLDSKAIGDVALRSGQVQALIAARAEAGANAAASASDEDVGLQVEMGSERWYGTYGVTARAEAANGAASSSVGSM